MKRKYKSTIAFKMTLLVLGGTSIVFALVQGYSYFYSKQILLKEVEQSARNLTLSVAGKIEQEFRAVAKVPQNLAYFLQSTEWDEGGVMRSLQRLVEGNREIYGAAAAFEPYAADEARRLFAPYFHKTEHGLGYVQLGDTWYDYTTKDWYHIPRVLQCPVWSEPYYDEGGAQIVMVTYSCPFFEGRGNDLRLTGIITADISLEWLTRLVSSKRVARSGYCFIVSDTGAFISHPDKTWIMSESMFSLAEERGDRALRKIGRAMIGEPSGFVDMGASLTGRPSFLAYALIPSTGWALGAVFPKEELFQDIEALHRTAVLLAVAGVALLLAVSVVSGTSMARPLRRMADAAGQVAEGNLDIDLSGTKRRDEVGSLARAFVRMTEGLKERDKIRSTFGRYVTREVVDRLLESKDGLKLGGEAREITMIMSDLRGFTVLASSMPPEEVLDFLNRYLGKMVDILTDHKGIIDEIIGDGILAFFGAPEPMENHPGAAVACALRMQEAMEEVNALNEADGLPRLEMGVAVNTGRVVVGNIGSEKRSKYGAVGSEVNFTGRMESFSVGGQVLVSQSTYDKLSGILQVKDILEVEMKGIPGKIRLYDVRGIEGDYSVKLDDRDEAPTPLVRPIEVEAYRLSQKVVTGSGIRASFTDISLTSAILVLDGGIEQWEDLRIHILDDPEIHQNGQVFAKVVSIAQADGRLRAMLRFTSVSPDAYKLFRKAMAASESM
ncbi:MAG: HAMP domain-containing protein [Deltaproteobacteria bacterium]|nr:HAMP domain-containing protein [Deltaproteobacteria bacterium]